MGAHPGSVPSVFDGSDDFVRAAHTYLGTTEDAIAPLAAALDPLAPDPLAPATPGFFEICFPSGKQQNQLISPLPML